MTNTTQKTPCKKINPKTGESDHTINGQFWEGDICTHCPTCATQKTQGHTKGPWIIGSNKLMVLTPGSGTYTALATVEINNSDLWNTLRIPRETAEANARLIAAAPELFEALKGCMGTARADAADALDIETNGKMTQEELYLTVKVASVKRALAAIAKAEGKA